VSERAPGLEKPFAHDVRALDGARSSARAGSHAREDVGLQPRKVLVRDESLLLESDCLAQRAGAVRNEQARRWSPTQPACAGPPRTTPAHVSSGREGRERKVVRGEGRERKVVRGCEEGR